MYSLYYTGRPQTVGQYSSSDDSGRGGTVGMNIRGPNMYRGARTVGRVDRNCPVSFLCQHAA